MLKKLLTLVAAATMAFGAYAADPVVLWQSDAEGGDLVNWGACYTMTAEEITAVVAPGDYLNMVIADVDPENGWPQVALNKAVGGWPPYCNSGVGGQTYPYTVSFPVTNDLYSQLEADGVMFTGDGAYIREVSYTKGVEIGPNTVWFGEKECGWGNGVSLAASVFENVKAGDKLVFYTSDQSYQVLLGGWSGLNVPCYEADDHFNVAYEDGVATYTLIEEYAETTTYGEGEDAKSLDVFALMKENGVVMHGTTTITRIDYIPAPVPNSTAVAIQEDYENAVALANQYALDVQDFYGMIEENFPAFWNDNEEALSALNQKAVTLSQACETALGEAAETGEYIIPAEIREANEELLAAVEAYNEAYAAIETAAQTDAETLAEYAAEVMPYTENDEFVAWNEACILYQYLANTFELIGAAQTEALEETGVYVSPLTEAVMAEINSGLNTIKVYEDYENAVALANQYALDVQDFYGLIDEEFPAFRNDNEEALIALNQKAVTLAQACETALGEAAETGEYVIPAEIRKANEELLALIEAYNEAYAAIETAAQTDAETLAEYAAEVMPYTENDEFVAWDEACILYQYLANTFELIGAAQTEAVTETGVYVSPLTEDVIAEINSGLNTIKVYEDYENAVALANEYTLAVQDFYGLIDEEFPGYWNVNEEALSALNQKAVTLSQACETALGEAAETGEYIIPAEIREANEELLALIEAYNEAYAAIERAAQTDAETLAEYAAEVMPYTENDEFVAWDEACILYQYLANTFELIGAAQTEAVTETGVYVSPLTEAVMAEINSGLNTIKVYEDYENAVALANEYTLAVQDFYGLIDEEFPGYWNVNEEALSALNQKAVTLSQACETALGEAAETGEYVIPAEIREANEELLALIEAYNEAYAAIETAAEADTETIAGYAADLEPYTEDYDGAAWDDACLLYQKLADLFEQVGAAKTEALEETGVYVSPLTEEVIADIDAALAEIKVASGISGIALDGANDMYFDLNGNNVINPVAGKVYIKVANGKVSKELIK